MLGFLAARSASEPPDASSRNMNPVIQILTWLLLALTSLMIGFRLMVRFVIKENSNLTKDDVIISIAFLLGIGESATMIIPQSDIFGRDMSDITDEKLRTGYQVGYARDMLFVLCICFSKLSVCESLLSLTPDQVHRRVITTLDCLIAAVGISTTLATAFQCGSSSPWDAEAVCFNQRAFLYFVSFSIIATDVLLIATAIWIIYPLHMVLSIRLKILTFYAFRISVVAASSCQIYYIPLLFGENFTYEAYPYYISMQLVQFCSVTAACAVYFWPFLRSLRSGLMHADASSLATQYPLSTLSCAYPSRFTVSANINSSTRNEIREGYIEITRGYEVSVLRGDQGKHAS
ncbi:hypothetical protein B0I35DRAFT_445395 [Stachybotrys elegans]|uniref:Rhodopsin domain-containing protein n=1 Tax=Stachybotrys elegans TaxID=80388 RepID=A0A8K0SER8_9HYPO|nr:hypothetical protein B0I35DRAFT_445395 [Stachybotrys elegans]